MYRFVVILVLIASISGQLSARKDYFEEDKGNASLVFIHI